jgi:FkbH-like protein
MIDEGQVAAAQSILGTLWRRGATTPATASFIVSRFEKLRAKLSLTATRLFIARSFTVEPVVPLLRAASFVSGFDLNVMIGDFNQYAQEFLDSASGMYGFEPNIVILALQTSELAPSLWTDFADLDAAAINAAVARSIDLLRNLVNHFRARSPAHLVIHTLQLPPSPANGILDAQHEPSQSDAIARINAGLGAIARSTRNVYLLDYNALIARRGEANWRDERKFLIAGLPIAANELIHLAHEWLRFIHPLTGRVCKVLAIDLDNTLWGGVIGEDGIDGIKLGASYPGAAYRNLQRAMLDLYRRGIILGVCSKNNPAEALEAIAKHPGMLLRPEHFASLRINWQDKATNLRELAKELNIGIDAIAFIDDNPVEREWVQSQLPEVTVIDLPADPMRFAAALRESPVFERLELSDEDRARGQYYAEQRLRTDLQQSAGSLEDFYRSLQMKVHIEPVTSKNLARAAQLTQKTNQFNLTTRRYTEAQLNELAPPHWRRYVIRVADRFGDNGIVGMAITRMQNDVCEIDTLLLSCRVIGRTIETAFLAAIASDARRAGARLLLGRFIPTKKNAPASDYFRHHGFAMIEQVDGSSVWELPLNRELSVPPWIELHIIEEAS